MDSNHKRVFRLSALIALYVPYLALAQSYSRTEAIAYHDDTTSWVMGQVKSVTCMSSAPLDDACDGGSDSVISRTDYGWKALPWKTYEFGKLRRTLAYDATSSVGSGQLGTLKQSTDGNGNSTTFTNWKRGIPQAIQFPATHESPSGATRSAVVNDLGLIELVRDEVGYPTCYQYDQMGRVSRITFPSMRKISPAVCGTDEWNPAIFDFQQVAVAEYGIPAGHWRQTASTGNARKITYYDALWRPVVTREYDAANEAGTKRFQRFDYDHEGRVTFASYPGATDALSTGTWTTYDSLGRQRSVSLDSELSPSLLTTTTSYLSNSAGAYTLVTTPAGQQTRTWFQAFDQPDYSKPIKITHPESASTHITRDIFGKPTRIRRSNSATPTGGTVAINRDYAYNTHQELCRVQEPEAGVTLMGYDGAGNLAWSAAGLTSAENCTTSESAAVVIARKAVRGYDARNRITSLSFPNGLGNTTHTYTPDGLPASIVANNGSPNIVNTEYSYNRRRMLEMERLWWGSLDWPLTYSYNANGHLKDQILPGNLTVGYAPNALGQPTQAGTYATGVTYYPNGAIKQFTYGNGVVHNLIQNARQLPERSYDCAVAGTGCTSTNKRLDLTYAYDTVGNVSGITDNRNGRQTRSMSYDGLDRLTQTISPMFGTASYTYNVLDNLTSVDITAGTGGRTHTYDYNAKNQVSNIRNTAGASVVALEYDLQGNVDVRAGGGVTNDYVFDYGNRLRSVAGKASYLYDGLGRRVRDYTAASKYNMYSQGGQLVYASDLRQGLATQYIYLGGSLVAFRERTLTTSDTVVKYQHTDALGTPTAVTDANKVIIETSEYEPYGQLVNGPLKDGPGFTGHVQDAATGLTYMQQRYYDPQVGLFLSVDPVTAYSDPVGQFNRYRYANNNPYGFIDPDGRQAFGHRDDIPWWNIGGHVGNWFTKTRDLSAQYLFNQTDENLASLVGQYEQAGDAILTVQTLALPEMGLAGPGRATIAKATLRPAVSASEASRLIALAGKVGANGENVALRKLISHAQRAGGTFAEPKGNVQSRNAAALDVISDIVSHPGSVRQELKHGFQIRIGQQGQGVRFNSDGSFNTFLDPVKRR